MGFVKFCLAVKYDGKCKGGVENDLDFFGGNESKILLITY